MTHIPSKGELRKNEATAKEEERQDLIRSQIKDFTAQIVAAMEAGKSSLPVRTRMPEPEAEAKLRSDFGAQGWTLNFKPARTGGSISWS